MKRLFTIIAFCAATAISAGALSNPAAADGGRHDSRRQAESPGRHQGAYFSGNKHRKSFRHDFRRRDRMFRRDHRRHRHWHGYGRGYGYRQDYRHRSPRSYGYGRGFSYLMGGSRLVIRLD